MTQPTREEGSQVVFEMELNAGESTTITVSFRGMMVEDYFGGRLRYQVTAPVRRHLCEFRDNDVMRKSFSK